MPRVAPPSESDRFEGLRVLLECGLPERIWLINYGLRRELFFDFSELTNASNPIHVEGVDEPVLTIGYLFSWIRLAGLTPGGPPVVVGANSGKFWLLSDEGPVLINWDSASLEKCFERRAQYREVARRKDYEETLLAFAALVEDVVRIEPRLGSSSDELLYWHVHLAGIADDLGLADFPFPWRQP